MNKIVELVQRRIWIGPLVGLIIGLGLGLLIGWVIAPVSWQPNADDVQAVADSYSLNNDAVLARARLKNLPRADQERIIKALVQERTSKGLTREAERLNALAQALGISVSPGAIGTPGAPSAPVATRPAGATTPAPSSGFDIGAIVPLILIVLVFILIAAAIAVFVLRVLPSLRARRAARKPATTESDLATSPREGELFKPRAPAPAPTTTPGGLGRFVPSYTLGNDNYDTSYSLESSRGEFLGECGMGISETIGEGKPDKVTAFDLWLFDKADVRTVTQILLSEHAFKDQNLRTKLSAKGEAILAEKGKTLHLETASLRVDAQIVELVYATNPSLPPNSHFQKLIVEIVPTLKTDGGTVR